MRESKRVELMHHQLNEIRKASNRLLRENQILQEENQLLQEKQYNEPKADK
jgi:regulator of replication initiation timing